MPTKLIFILLLLLFACQPAEKTETSPTISHYVSERTKTYDLPFSDAVRVGKMLYLSGKIGRVPGEHEGIEAESRVALERIREVLEANGSSFEQVVKVTVMLADMEEWAAFNEVYVEYFPKNRPARSAFAASGLAVDSRVEIECIATVN